MHEKEKSNSLEFSTLSSVAFQTKCLSHFWYKHTKFYKLYSIHSWIHWASWMYFISIVYLWIWYSLKSQTYVFSCIPTNPQSLIPGHPTAAVCTSPQSWCRARESTQPHLGSLRIQSHLLLSALADNIILWGHMKTWDWVSCSSCIHSFHAISDEQWGAISTPFIFTRTPFPPCGAASLENTATTKQRLCS